MRMHIKTRATVLTLYLSLAAAAAFAGDVPATPSTPPASPAAPGSAATPTPPAPAEAAPSPPSPPSTWDADEARLEARTYAAHAREEAALRARMDAAHQREETARQREDELRAQMNAARRRLEIAAQQLAALSAQMYGPMMQRVEALAGPPHALLGVQLDDSTGGTGARVRDVSPGGAAEQAGVRRGDRIVAVDGTSVQGRQPALRVVELLHGVKPGDKVDLKVSRDGKTRDLTLTARPAGDDFFIARQLPDMPDMPAMPNMPNMPAIADLPSLPRVRALAHWDGPMFVRGPVADMELCRLTPGLGRYFGTDTGVLVVRAPADGGLGLQDGDVILSIGGRKPIDSAHAIRILASYDPGEKITLEVMRQHRRISLATTLPSESKALRGVIEIPKGAMLEPGPVVRLSGDDRTQ